MDTRAPRAALSPSLNFFKLRRVRALSSLPRGSSVFSSPRGRLARVAGDSGRRRLLRQHRRVRSLTAYASRCSVGPTSALPPPSCRAEQGAVSSSQETVESRRPSQNLVAALDEGGKDGRRRRRGPTLSLSLLTVLALRARSPPLSSFTPFSHSHVLADGEQAGGRRGRASGSYSSCFLPSFLPLSPSEAAEAAEYNKFEATTAAHHSERRRARLLQLLSDSFSASARYVAFVVKSFVFCVASAAVCVDSRPPV